MGGGVARPAGDGARFQGSSRAQLQGIDMALPELACNRRLVPAHRALFIVPGRGCAFSSLPLPRARTRAGARMRERACERVSISDPSPTGKQSLPGLETPPLPSPWARQGEVEELWVVNRGGWGRGQMEIQLADRI